MKNDNELAAAFSLLKHEHLLTLCNLRDELNLTDVSNVKLDSEIGMSLSKDRDGCRLYLACYFEYGNKEYKFVICVNREDAGEKSFLLGFRRKDNRKIVSIDVVNCNTIVSNVNSNLKTNYGFSDEGKTLYLNPLSVDNLKKFLDNACLSLTKIKNFRSDCKNAFLTLTRAREIIKNELLK